MFCRKCGKELADDSLFCSACGQSVNEKPTFNETPVSSTKDENNEPNNTSKYLKYIFAVLIGLVIAIPVSYFTSIIVKQSVGGYIYRSNDYGTIIQVASFVICPLISLYIASI